MTKLDDPRKVLETIANADTSGWDKAIKWNKVLKKVKEERNKLRTKCGNLGKENERLVQGARQALRFLNMFDEQRAHEVLANLLKEQ